MVTPGRGPIVGLVGFAYPSGLGNTNRDFYRQLPFDRWLAINHPRFGLDPSFLDDRCQIGAINMSGKAVDDWLDGLDAVFAIQAGYAPDLWRRAAERGILTALMPNAEWFAPALPDMAHIDRFIAPTRSCEAMLHRTGFGPRTRYLPHPVDTKIFRFRRRQRADAFLHVRGWGDGDRKGTQFVLEAARRCPDISFFVRAQDHLRASWPANVRLLNAVDDPGELYAEGDIAIQPSRYEGVGLPILEAMACGLPAIVPDAAPMNEHPDDPLLVVAAERHEQSLVGNPFPACTTDVDDLVRVIRSLHRQMIGDLSDAARSVMEARSWDRLRPAFREALGFESGSTGVSAAMDYTPAAG